MKRALMLLAQRLPAGSRLISTVHDEVIVEAPEAVAEQTRAVVQAAMIEAMAALFPQVAHRSGGRCGDALGRGERLR